MVSKTKFLIHYGQISVLEFTMLEFANNYVYIFKYFKLILFDATLCTAIEIFSYYFLCASFVQIWLI